MRVAVIGADIGGLSVAAYLAQAGCEVDLFEKGSQEPDVFMDGFTFSKGSGWYMMPEVFEQFFNDFGCKVSDFYHLEKITPSYQIYGLGSDVLLRPEPAIYRDFNEVEEGAGPRLANYLGQAEQQYSKVAQVISGQDLVKFKWLLRPKMSFWQQSVLFGRLWPQANTVARNSTLRSALKFLPLAFGQKASSSNAWLNWVALGQGSWQPLGGMGRVIAAFELTARKQGVRFYYDSEIGEGVNGNYDKVVSIASHHTTRHAVVVQVGLDHRLPVVHNSLFVEDHPFFHLAAPSITDSGLSPDGHENLTITIPTNAVLTTEQANNMADLALERIARNVGENVKSHVVVRRVTQRPEGLLDYLPLGVPFGKMLAAKIVRESA
jgi:phytoene desaturase